MTTTKEFKREAVRLLETTNKTGAEISREFGIKCNQLYKWREEVSIKDDNALQY